MDSLSLGVIGGLLAGICLFAGWMIKRHFVDQRWAAMGRSVYAAWQNGDERHRIEYVNYLEEDAREEDKEGEFRPGRQV